MKQIYYKTLFTLIFTIIFNTSYSQEKQHDSTSKAEKSGGFVITLTPAFTWVPKGADVDNLNENGHFTPGLGADFFYRFHPKWEIGIMLDYEFNHYIIPRKNNLERENAFVTALMFAYTINSRWNVFAGGGIEFEKHENIGVARLGGEYVIPMKKGWFIPIGAFIDWKKGYHAWSLNFGIGKNF